MTVAESIGALTPLDYIMDESNIISDAEKGGYICGFHRAKLKAVSKVHEADELMEEMVKALEAVAESLFDVNEHGISVHLNQHEIDAVHAALQKHKEYEE